METKQNDRFQEITGHLYKIFPKVTFESGFEKREFVIEKHTEGRDGMKYKDLIKFEATKSWIGQMENIGLGSEVKVHFTLGGKEWTPADAKEPRYINYLRAWKIEVIENTNQDIKTEAKAESADDFDFNNDDDGQLPF